MVIEAPVAQDTIPDQQLEDSVQQQAPVKLNSSSPATAVYMGTGQFIKPLDTSPVTKNPAKTGSHTLNFSNVSIAEVATVILGDALGLNFAIDPQVTGNVSLQTAQPLSESELLPALELLLRMHGAVLVVEDSLYRVQLAKWAIASGTIPFSTGGETLPIGFQIRIIPLKYIGVQEMQKILVPVLPENAVLQTDVARNLLVVTGSQSELSSAQELVNLFDVNIMRGQSVGLFPLTFTDAETIRQELIQLFNSDTEKPLAGMLRMIPIERMNALMVITQQPKYLAQVKQWITRLDSGGVQGQASGVYVYQVQNVDAVDLAEVLEKIYPSEKERQVARPAAQLAPGLKPTVIKSDSGLAPAQTLNSPSRINTEPAISGKTTGPIQIIPNEGTNALVIVASRQDYESLLKITKQLDVIPLQVLIDATIVEVSLTDELHYGLQWFFNNNFGDYDGDGRVGSSNLRNAGVGGFSYSLVNSAGVIKAKLNALSSDSRVNVLSAPSLMVLNNQEATIKVGDQVPIRTSESTNTNSAGIDDSGIITSTIEMRDTGVTLTVKPRVNAGGLVIMEVQQDVDGVTVTDSSEIDSPTIQQRQIITSVAVQSGETIVLGGLITEQREEGKSGVPVLSSLPWIGSLFGKTDKVLDRTELVVMITPRVVANAHDTRSITREFKTKLTNIYVELEDAETDAAN